MKTAWCLALLSVLSASISLAQPATQPSAPATRPTEMPADQLLNQMLRPAAGPTAQPLRPSPNPPALDQTTGKMVVPGVAPAINLRREGEYVRDRLGRLSKSADGNQMEFTFESDGRTMQDPPLIILPNLALTRMEDAISGNNKDLRFRITGLLTEYKGRNYILIEKVSVVPDRAQTF
jgi:hypothetical protein